MRPLSYAGADSGGSHLRNREVPTNCSLRLQRVAPYAILSPLQPHNPLAQTMNTTEPLRYRRILLKLSGEVLGNPKAGESIDATVVDAIADRVAEVVRLGVQVGIVLGGGNIFRGLSGAQKGVNRTSGDYMGMLATIINGLAMQNAL